MASTLQAALYLAVAYILGKRLLFMGKKKKRRGKTITGKICFILANIIHRKLDAIIDQQIPKKRIDGKTAVVVDISQAKAEQQGS